MKLGISNIAWNLNETQMIYSIMKKYGFTGIEIAPTKTFGENPYGCKIDEIRKFKNEIEKYGLNLIAMQSILYGKSNLNVFDKNTSNQLKLYISKCIDFSYEIGCPNIVFGSPKNRIYNKEQDYKTYAYDFFKEIGKYAYQYNIKFCIESNPIEYGTNFINNLKEQMEFIDICEEKGLGMHIDLGAMIINDEEFSKIQYIINKIDHIHLSLPYLEVINKETVKVFKELKYILDGYEKYISIEMKSNTNNNILNIEEAISSVRSLF